MPETHTTGALMFNMPEHVSWALGDTSGNDMASLVQALRAQDGGSFTLSITCIVELDDHRAETS